MRCRPRVAVAVRVRDLDAAALQEQSLHGSVERPPERVLVDAERKGATDPLDREHVLAGCGEGREIALGDVRAEEVVVWRVAGLAGLDVRLGLAERERPVEHDRPIGGAHEVARLADERAHVEAAAIAEPVIHVPETLRRLGGVGDDVDMNRLGPKACLVEGDGHGRGVGRQAASVELVGPATHERARQNQVDPVLEGAIRRGVDAARPSRCRNDSRIRCPWTCAPRRSASAGPRRRGRRRSRSGRRPGS